MNGGDRPFLRFGAALPQDRSEPKLPLRARSAIGLLLILFAMVLYPLWGWAAGHGWPNMPVFGVAPCPTTIFTIGILLTGTWRVARWLLIVPGLWAAVGGSAAIFLAVPQDFALLASLALLVLFVVGRSSGLRFARHAAMEAVYAKHPTITGPQMRTFRK